FRNTIQFLDESIYAENWYWDFGTGMNDYSTLQFPVFTYEDTLTYTVGLIVKKFWHSNTTLGCYDTISHDIFIEPEMSYHLPNAFSPNGDGLNDKFIGVGYFVTITDFSMQVWTRWGELVYESSDIEEGWNGRLFNNGDQVNDGVYVYVVAIKDKTFATHKFKGFVILVD
ncbi:MAG: gliding motility-associated C-terminal domain-containing protein, partial [Bacteroidetes bacterium]|nr:gliding motility-associated C-terminal domain-containing protein [Bacteroidota bacterium]